MTIGEFASSDMPLPALPFALLPLVPPVSDALTMMAAVAGDICETRSRGCRSRRR
jgi:hypothetical protein